MTFPTLTSGDDWLVNATLYQDEARATALTLTGSTISAAVVSTDHATVLVAATAQTLGAANADGIGWDVTFEWLAAITGAAARGKGVIECQITNGAGKKYTWYSPEFTIERGNIA